MESNLYLFLGSGQLKFPDVFDTGGQPQMVVL